MLEKECLVCGEKFTTTDTNYRKKFCSRKCQLKSIDLKRYPILEKEEKCVWCEKIFHKRLNNQKKIYCSHECAMRSNEKKSSDRNKLNPEFKYKQYITNAKKRNINFSLSLEYFINNFWKKTCFYCGNLIETAGVDRMDSSKGYEQDNCVPCCEHCNMMKQSDKVSDFFSHIKQIYKHSKLD